MIVPEGAAAGIINPRLIRFTFDPELVVPRFFKELFESEQIQRYLERTSQGGTMGVLNATMLRSLEIPLPSSAEQQAIAEVLSDMDAEIAALESRRAKTAAVKQGMMQALLTGKVRLFAPS